MKLSSLTTFGIGGEARNFGVAKTEKELVEMVKEAGCGQTDYFILGGGSNLLVSDSGYEGMVIKNETNKIARKGDVVKAASGVVLQELIDYLIDAGLAGMEAMSGIPGTVGGAIRGNAGAYGQSISDHLTRVKIFDEEKVRWILKKEGKFGYRESVFKNNDWVILGGEFRFERGDKKKMREEAKRILKMRAEKYPKSLKSPGSFFKNVVASTLSPTRLKKIPKEKIVYGKIPAGYLLEEVGMKGVQKGKIKFSDYHANLVVNLGGGKAKDVVKLVEMGIEKVKKKFGIILEPEVELVGLS